MNGKSLLAKLDLPVFSDTVEDGQKATEGMEALITLFVS